MGVCPKAQLPTYRIRFRGSPELSKQLMPFPEDGPCTGHLGTSLLCVRPPPAVVEGTETSWNTPTASRPRLLPKSPCSVACPVTQKGSQLGADVDPCRYKDAPSSAWLCVGCQAFGFRDKQWELCSSCVSYPDYISSSRQGIVIDTYRNTK